MWTTLAAASLSLAALAAGLPQAAERDDLETRIRAIAREASTEGGLEGLTVAIAIGSDTLVAEGTGASSGPEKPYRVGALTEPFTALAILQLAERGKLDPDDPVSKHLPELDWEETVTVHHLLAHTSGVPSTAVLAPGSLGAPPEQRARVLEELRGHGLDFSPGTCFTYSDADYLLLGFLVEKLSGEALPAYLAAEVFAPLGMDATAYTENGPKRFAGAPSVQEVGGDSILLEHAERPFRADELCSTAGDLLRWVRGLADRTLLEGAAYRRMFTAGRLADGTRIPYGCGFSTTELERVPGVSCGGAIEGYQVRVAFYPDAELAIALLACCEERGLGRLEQRLARLVLDIDEPGILDLPLSAEERAPYVGLYQIGCSHLRVVDANERLAVQTTNRPEWTLLFQGEHRFVVDGDPDVRLTFEVEDEGNRARSFVLDERGVQSMAVRID